MGIYKGIMFALGLTLLIIRVCYDSLFNVDTAAIILFVILCLPIGAEILVKAKIFGAEFQFKDKINETKNYVDKSKLAADKKSIIKLQLLRGE